MSTQNQQVTYSLHKKGHGNLKTYIAGYIISIVLTLSAYLVVVNHVSTKWIIVGTIAVFAFIQFIVQLVFFLHLSVESKPRWKLMVFILMVSVVLILVIGSLWIMHNLDYERMSLTPKMINQYMQSQQGL